mgnify:FL=1
MTKNVGFDEFYESGGAVEPSEAADSLLDFAATITEKHNGQFWAPRGPRSVEGPERHVGSGADAARRTQGRRPGGERHGQGAPDAS